MKLVDLSLELKHGSLSYPGTSTGIVLQSVSFEAQGGTLSKFAHLDPHSGTHFDAPLHFIPHSTDVASAPLQLPEILLVSSDTSPIPEDALDTVESAKGKAVLFSTGWEEHAGTARFFEGYPVLSPRLAQVLVEQEVAIVGLDSPSPDPATGGYPAHRTLLSAGIPILEGLVNLPELIPHLQAEKTVCLAAFPLRIQGLEGSPVRAVAIIT